jgi:hypothetical protein
MGSDNYVLNVGQGEDIWVGASWDNDTNQILSAWLDSGPVTPDDTATETYVTIGFASPVPDSEAISPINKHCGDIVFYYPPQQDVGEGVQELVLVADTDDGQVRWLETETCPCAPETPSIDGGGP